MYIFGEDIAQTDPDTAHVVDALDSARVPRRARSIFENETTKYADVVLPASAFLEKDGTFTNAERRIQLVEPASTRPGERQDRLRDHHDLSRRALGHEMGHDDRPEDVMDEIAALTPHFAGVTYERLGRARPAVAGRARRHRLADPLRGAVRAPGGRGAPRRAALQGARRRGQPRSSR